MSRQQVKKREKAVVQPVWYIFHLQSDYAGCGEMMKRVLECGDVELSNNLSEQMMRSIKMNLKNAGNIGSEEYAKHNAFMFSVIKSCNMNKRLVKGDDLTDLLPCNLAT